MTDIERVLRATMDRHVADLEMPNRLPAIRRRARRARWTSIGITCVLLASTSLGTVWATSLLRDRKERTVPPAREGIVPVRAERLSFDGSGAFDIVADEGRIWIAAHDGRETFRTRLLEIDAAQNTIRETGVHVGAAVAPAEFAVGEGALWVRTDRLFKVDPNTEAIADQIPLSGYGLAVAHGSLWTAEVARLDVRDGALVAEIPDAAGQEVVADDASVWVGRFGPGRVTQIDPATNEIVGTTSRPGFRVEDLVSDGRDAWIAWAQDPGPASVTETAAGSSGAAQDPVELPGVEVVSDLIFARDRLWVVGYGRHQARLFQIDPTTMALIGDPLELEGTQLSLAATQDALWVADLDRPVVTKIELVECGGSGCAEEVEDREEPVAACREPRLHARPAAAPIGARVELRGDCFTGGYWRQQEPNSGYGIFLIGHVDDEGYPVREESRVRCEVIGFAGGRFDIDRAGHFTGHFVVPNSGACFQASTEVPIRPGRYNIGVGCHACSLTTFRVRS